MLLKFRIPFKQQDHDHHDQNQRRSSSSPCNSNHKPNFGNKHERKAKRYSPVAQVGLRIVVQISSQDHQEFPSNVVVNSSLKLTQSRTHSKDYSCFLKTCHLCNKGLKLDKEIYMYRGDQGFCSIECRNRQIFMDEMQELEASTKRMVASYRNSCNPRKHETCFLLEELSHSTKYNINSPLITNHHHPHRRNNRAIFIA